VQLLRHGDLLDDPDTSEPGIAKKISQGNPGRPSRICGLIAYLFHGQTSAVSEVPEAHEKQLHSSGRFGWPQVRRHAPGTGVDFAHHLHLRRLFIGILLVYAKPVYPQYLIVPRRPQFLENGAHAGRHLETGFGLTLLMLLHNDRVAEIWAPPDI